MNDVYFENAKFYHYPLIIFYLWRRFNIYIFNFNFIVKKKCWLRYLVDNKKVHKISYNIVGGDSLALDNIEKAYCFTANRSKLISSMIRIYDDEDISLAYRKMLAQKLSVFYAVQIFLEKEKGKLKNSEKIIFIPDRYLESLKIVEQCKAFSYELEKVSIPLWIRWIARMDGCISKAYSWISFSCVSFCGLAMIMLKCLVPAHKKNVCKYRYAVPITRPYFQFKFKEDRSFDFILDHNDINKDNTLFLWLSSVDKAHLRKLKKAGYSIVNCSTKSLFMLPAFGLSKRGIVILKTVFKYVSGNLILSIFENDCTQACSNILLNAYLKWKIILSSMNFDHYVTFSDEGVNHIGRNSLLRRIGCKTWYYAHSGSFVYVLTNKDIDIVKRRELLSSFLLYDYYIVWNKPGIEDQKHHPQKIKKYFNVGCLWSEFIVNGDKGKGLDFYLGENGVNKKEIKEDSKVVSFFDTTYFDGISSEMPLVYGIKFYRDIMRLVEEEQNLFIVIKEKRAESKYSDRGSILCSPSRKEYSQVLEGLRDHPRCFVAGYDADPTAIIKMSDLVVACAFTSSTLEALGAKKKAIFYDPDERFRGYYYDQIPRLVAHGYTELKSSIHSLLYNISDDQYEEYLQKEILGKVEDYLDGKGLSRFRTLLIKA